MLHRRNLLVQPNRQRGGTGGGSGGPVRDEALPEVKYVDLPPYEPLQLPLTDNALRTIAELANRSGTTRVYETQLKKSAELLRDMVSNLNDTYADRKTQLADLEERREESSRTEPSRTEEELAKAVAQLDEVVGPLTARIERAARQTIDWQMELEDERSALMWTDRTASVRLQEERLQQQRREMAREQRRRERRLQRAAAAAAATAGDGEDGGEGGEEDAAGDGKGEEDGDDFKDTPPTSVVSLLQEARDTRKAAYAALTAHQKYGLNNDYISFKQMWHDARYPDGDVTLPDASAWFDAAGEPALYGPDAQLGSSNGGGGGAAGGGGEGAGDNDDDDLVVAREVISFKCPLTLVTMTDPYKSRVCNHTFEKAGIMEYLRHGPKKCPQTGCDQDLHAGLLQPDQVMRRRVERAAQVEQGRFEMDDGDDVGVEDGDVESMIAGPSRKVRLRRKDK